MGEGPEVQLRTLVVLRKTPARPCLPLLVDRLPSSLCTEKSPIDSSIACDVISKFACVEGAIEATGTAEPSARVERTRTQFARPGLPINAPRRVARTMRLVSKPSWNVVKRR